MVAPGQAQEAIVRERRNVFELGLLARLVDICGHNKPGAVEAVAGLLMMRRWTGA